MRLREFFSGSLRRQLIFGVAAVHAVMMSLFVWDLTERQQDMLLDRQAEQAQALAQTLATSAAGWLAARDIAGLQELAEAQRRYPQLAFAMLLDREGQVLAHTERARQGQYVSDLPQEAKLTLLARGSALVDAIAPATLAGHAVGWARVGIGQQEAREKLDAITRNGVLYALIAIAIGSILALLMGNRLTRKLYAIRRASETVRAGREEARVPDLGGDEAGQLARDFNAMLDALSSSEKRLTDAEITVRESEERFRATFSQAAVGIAHVSLDGHFLRLNQKFCDIAGYSCDELPKRTFQDITHPDDLDTDLEYVRRMLAGDIQNYSMEKRYLRKDGSIVWINLTVSLVRDEKGNPKYFISVIEDISGRKRDEAQMRQLSSAVEQTADVVVITDRQGMIEYANPAYEQVTGYSRQEVLGKNASVVKSGEHGERFYEEMWQTILAGQVFRGTMANRRKDGLLYYEEKTISPLKDAGGNIVRFVSTGKDITGRLQSEEQLQHLAHFDHLTGLPNRVLLQDRLKQAMVESDQRERMVAVMFLDLDRFKTINDTLGHDTGDALLKAVAERMAVCLRPGDTVSRLGGDEFSIILANVAHVNDVTRVAQKILDQFISPHRIGGRDLFVSPSIGITIYPLDEKDIASLFKDADVAMYHAKELGGNTFQFYTSELNTRAARRLELETGLRQALERQEFVLHYQPLVDMKTGRIRGMEALLRWQHPKFGLIPPLDFIPLAEETGLIIPIGEWVLKTACAQIKAWHGTGFPALQVAVNLSSKQVRDKNLIDAVKRALDAAGLEARYLDLELTESVLMQDMELATTILKELKAVGVFFSLDDFGTGYSSLSYLKRFPIDYLKIDRSFVRDITTDPVGAGLVQAIIAMANVLNIKVIAEGVETYEQLEFLRSHGCDITQGYYCSPPVNAETFTDLLRDWSQIRAGKCSIKDQ